MRTRIIKQIVKVLEILHIPTPDPQRHAEMLADLIFFRDKVDTAPNSDYPKGFAKLVVVVCSDEIIGDKILHNQGWQDFDLVNGVHTDVFRMGALVDRIKAFQHSQANAEITLRQLRDCDLSDPKSVYTEETWSDEFRTQVDLLSGYITSIHDLLFYIPECSAICEKVEAWAVAERRKCIRWINLAEHRVGFCIKQAA